MAGPRLIERPAPDLAGLLAEDVSAWLAEAIGERGMASLVVPGGSTPRPFLEALARRPIDWPRVFVVPSDERCVPLDSPRSNEAMIRARLLQGPAAAANFLSLLAAGEDGDAIAAVATRVRRLLPIDVCVLGLGEDGHTASLFPQADRIAEALADDASSVLPIQAPGAGERRITLTAPVLRGARRVCLLFTGAAKREVLARALEAGPLTDLPVRVVLGRSDSLHLYWSP